MRIAGPRPSDSDSGGQGWGQPSAVSTMVSGGGSDHTWGTTASGKMAVAARDWEKTGLTKQREGNSAGLWLPSPSVPSAAPLPPHLTPHPAWGAGPAEVAEVGTATCFFPRCRPGHESNCYLLMLNANVVPMYRGAEILAGPAQSWASDHTEMQRGSPLTTSMKCLFLQNYLNNN